MKIIIELDSGRVSTMDDLGCYKIQCAVADSITTLLGFGSPLLDGSVQEYFNIAVFIGMPRCLLESFGEALHKAGCNIADLGPLGV